MKFKRFLAIGLMTLLTATSLTACAQRGSTDTGAAAAAATAESGAGASSGASTDAPVDISKDEIKIAVAVVNMDTNTTSWVEGIEEGFSNYPNVTTQVFTADGSAETQSNQLQEIINQKFDGVILHAADPAAAASLTADAEKAGINVWHLQFGPDTPHTGGVHNNTYKLGVAVANDAFERTGGKAKVVAIGPPVELSTVILSVDGLEDTLKDMDGMELLESQAGDWTTERANAIMRDFLSKYNNDIQVVFANNDQMAVGAAQAIDAAGLTGKILVYGADGSPNAIEYIAEGKMTATVAVDNVQMGQDAAHFILYALATGVNGGNLPQTPVIDLPQTLICSDNVDEFK